MKLWAEIMKLYLVDEITGWNYEIIPLFEEVLQKPILLSLSKLQPWLSKQPLKTSKKF